MIITFFGDFVCQNPGRTQIGNGLKKLIAASDFNIVNFEAPIHVTGAVPIHKSGPNINQPAESAAWLENNKFNVIALANNHLLDFGPEIAKITKQAFKKAATFGIGNIDNAYRSLIIEKNGIKTALISVTHHEFSCVEDYGYGCAWMHSPLLLQEISSIKPQVDHIVILNHGGLEYFDQPLQPYRELYRHWIDLGADAVVASHPHVPQGWEEHNGKPIFYSLGNFCFEKTDGIYPPMWNNSLAVTIDLGNNIINYRVSGITYNPSTAIVETDNSEDFANHIAALNATLRTPDSYSAAINEKMHQLASGYNWMLNAGKYPKIGFTKEYLKAIARFILRRPADSVHHLNLYRCETHRWVMEYLLSHNML